MPRSENHIDLFVGIRTISYSHAPLCENMASSTKPEVLQLHVTCEENLVLVWTIRFLSYAGGQTYRQSDRHTDYSSPSHRHDGDVINFRKNVSLESKAILCSL